MSAVAAKTLEEPIRRSVAAVDRDQAVADVKTIDELEAEDVAPDRLRSILVAAFAAVAVVLTALGLYGVTVVKVFLFDMAGLGEVYRILAFLVLAVLLGVAAGVYQRIRPEREQSGADTSAGRMDV